jgi:putative glutamine amidotransferase
MVATGGGDVDPSRYGEQTRVDLMDVDPVRDEWEFTAIPYWLERGRPLLGICRGLQVLAVVSGGKLHQDLPTAGYNNHWMADRAHEPVHGVRVTPGSLAERALGGRNKVNSIHHQAVKELGAGLVPTAWSDDDVIEAVEAADGRPVVGLQWHPERLACPPHPADADPRHLAIFTWLVEAADRAEVAV